ncbi:hypothetical protein BO82DRAFT_211308 [Aspergillus uvarum CBS 121591]|uniref:Uncharacterized protein n=1 Tax=Aspergillus uvarum CBS 121591 TaxID=1448315 RepID=A0A319CGR7_9EURO|nr:hypothetical protein BO82DRAFT_211308 [Aspergillus uvarum CBS 121591]PYH84835.1 hypothetical protein BO82DRAFT_211308 [Aspergillus uvarum CBS 121591]
MWLVSTGSMADSFPFLECLFSGIVGQRGRIPESTGRNAVAWRLEEKNGDRVWRGGGESVEEERERKKKTRGRRTE